MRVLPFVHLCMINLVQNLTEWFRIIPSDISTSGAQDANAQQQGDNLQQTQSVTAFFPFEVIPAPALCFLMLHCLHSFPHATFIRSTNWL